MRRIVRSKRQVGRNHAWIIQRLRPLCANVCMCVPGVCSFERLNTAVRLPPRVITSKRDLRVRGRIKPRRRIIVEDLSVFNFHYVSAKYTYAVDKRPYLPRDRFTRRARRRCYGERENRFRCTAMDFPMDARFVPPF